MKTIILYLLLGVSHQSNSQFLHMEKRIAVDTIKFPGEKPDSAIVGDLILYSHADLRNVGDCNYIQFVFDSIVSQIDLDKRGERGYQSLKAYFERITNGVSNHFLALDSPVQIGVIHRNDEQLLVTLFTTKRHKHTKLSIERLRGQ